MSHYQTFNRVFLLFILTSVCFFSTGLAQEQASLAAEDPALNDLVSRLIASKNDGEVETVLASAPTLVDGNLARALVKEADRQRGQVQGSAIERIYAMALSIAERVNDKVEIARSLHGVASVLGDREKQRAVLERGIAISREANEPGLTARFLISIGAMEADMAEQVKIFESAISLAESAGQLATAANAYGRIGNNYAMRGKYPDARTAHAKSIELKEKIGDQEGIGMTLSNLGIVDQMQGDLTSAQANYEKSLAIAESFGDKDGAGIVSYNLGNVFLQKGDHGRAMELYTKSLGLFEEIGANGGIEGVSTNIANLYNAQGSYELARSYLDRASKIADPTGKTIPQYALGSYGDSYKGEGRYDKAIEFYQRLLALKEKGENKDSIAETLINIGNTYLMVPDAEKAERSFRRALELSTATGTDTWISQSYLGLAGADLVRRDFQKGLANADLAKTHLQKVDPSLDHWGLHTVTGRAQMGLGLPDDARKSLMRAVDVVEKFRDQVAGSSSERQNFFEDKLEPYHLLTELLISEGAIAEAYKYVEMGKARTLADTLGTGKLDMTVSMTSDETAQERSFRNELVSLTTQIRNQKRSSKPDPSILAELETQLEKKRLEFRDFQNSLYIAHPELMAFRGRTAPLALDMAARLFSSDDTAVVEFGVAADRSFAFVITRDAKNKPLTKAVQINTGRTELSRRVDAYRSTLAAGGLDFQERSRELYDLLLKPFAAQLAGKAKLIIVPDGPLWDLPFQTLRDGSGKFLVENAAVSYAPSLTALNEIQKKAGKKAPIGLELLAFGNPKVGTGTAEKVKRVFMSEKLEPLPEAERLVAGLAKMYGSARSKTFTGAAAREQVAKTEAPKYRIVQFATHGILNNVSPMYSHLVLARDEKDPKEDGLLEAWEMKDLDLKADMVILSACDTARGKISGGEGVVGMTWAMFIAGTPTTVASQWKVESSSTTDFMLEFHRQMLGKEKISKAEALRRAALKIMKTPKYRHPSYWGGWVLLGDGS